MQRIVRASTFTRAISSSVVTGVTMEGESTVDSSESLWSVASGRSMLGHLNALS